jgi:NAD(P)-dependent dehydrogenase (short-subunit alcohol dehydrogenase family)
VTCVAIRGRGGKVRDTGRNLSDVSAVNTMISEVWSDLSPINIMVNNAGINVGKNRLPIHEFAYADWHKIIGVDLDGVFFCVRAVSARIISRGKGGIIYITCVFRIGR